MSVPTALSVHAATNRNTVSAEHDMRIQLPKPAPDFNCLVVSKQVQSDAGGQSNAYFFPKYGSDLMIQNLKNTSFFFIFGGFRKRSSFFNTVSQQ
jgi:hypothetical protein